ncbi:MAG: universal stress protein [Rubrobacteraceae bacterium]
MVDHLPAGILLATDGSVGAALPAAVELSSKTASELHIAHVRPTFPPYSHIALTRDSELRESQAREILFERLDEIEAAGGKAAGAHLLRGDTVREILALAGEMEAGLIVVGSRGLGPLRRLFFGSVSEGVASRASCPVLIARGAAWPPVRVVVGDDSSVGAKRAREFAADVADLFDARLVLTRALPLFMDMAEAAQIPESGPTPPHVALGRHEMVLESHARKLRDGLWERPEIRVGEGEAASVILRAAGRNEGPTLVAVGRRGLGRVNRLRLGSVSTRVLREAPGPVLICPS